MNEFATSNKQQKNLQQVTSNEWICNKRRAKNEFSVGASSE